MRREQDKVSKWLIDHIVNSSLSYRNKMLNIILFRIYNRIETGELLNLPIDFDENFNPEDYRMICSKKFKYYTSVFNTIVFMSTMANYSPNGAETLRSLNPFWFIKYLIDTEFVEKYLSPEHLKDKTPLYVFDKLTSLNCIGRFYAYQFFMDFTYVDDFPFSENYFVMAGPGCEAGEKILFKDFDGLSLEEALIWLTEKLNRELDFSLIFSDLPEHDQKMNLACIENCFCEFYKYYKFKTGTGKIRNRYPGVLKKI